MRRVFKLHKCFSNPKRSLFPPSDSITSRPQNHSLFLQERILHSESSESTNTNSFQNVVDLFSRRNSSVDDNAREDLEETVEEFKNLIDKDEDISKVVDFLEEKGLSLLRRYADGSACIELLNHLDSKPELALQILSWRRKLSECGLLMTPEEYAKGIKIAGRCKNVKLAVDLFSEARSNDIKTISTYNALMGAFMYNNLADNCRMLFKELKEEEGISPSVVTFNIMISVDGSLMLVDHMESTLSEMKDLGISPNVETYNYLITGYLTAWMWEDMEQTYQTMLASTISPNTKTYLLMLRGYAISGKLEEMEAIYELVKDYVNKEATSLIFCMIHAYCRNAKEDRIKKIEELMKLLPDEHYKGWVYCLLIKLYAQEDMIDRMENYINVAFERNLVVASGSIVRAILGSYFRCNEVDRLVDFAKRAECAGWRTFRSTYHAKMILFASQRRLEELEGVLDEMEHARFKLTRRTFVILFKAYNACHQVYKARQVVGMMLKRGYDIPFVAALT